MTVLIVTASDDLTATRVRRALGERGVDHVQWDLGDFPQRLSFAASTGPNSPWAGRLDDGERMLQLADVRSVYYRRPNDFCFPDNLSAEHRRFASKEARHGLGGLLSWLPARWVNHPSRIADAEFKPVQLRVADEVGFRIPRTLITSDAKEARAFVSDVGKVVYKPLTSPFIREGDELKMIYTSIVEADQIDDDTIALTANQFQQWVPKKHDVRMIVVGEHCFSTIIHAGTDSAHVDWRSDYLSLSYETTNTPEHVARAAIAYLRRFGLAFGAFDFAVTATDEWWFLECNPNGQWGWIEHETGFPIGSAIADLLIGKTTTI